VEVRPELKKKELETEGKEETEEGTYTNSSVIVRLSPRQFDRDLREFDGDLRQS
jgi:hypothetical protein